MDAETLDDILRAAVGCAEDEDAALGAFCEEAGFPERTLRRMRRGTPPRRGTVRWLAGILAPMLGQSVDQVARRIQGAAPVSSVDA